MAIAKSLKYLSRHAEPIARRSDLGALARFGPWSSGVIVPARSEAIDCLQAVPGPGLCVLVINATEADARPSRALLDAVADAGEPLWRADELSLVRTPRLDVLAIDRCSPGRVFAAHEGVGQARKLGADLLLRLADLGIVRSRWLHTTDADARLPTEHVTSVEACAAETPEAVATVAPFWHEPCGDPAIDRATAEYELSLRYFVAGLAWAGSPYAFHTIGSLISVRADAYAAVRGFPRRLAGEDFYLLNKLAKLGPIIQRPGAPVRIASRRSTRAPFGTGPAVEARLRGGPWRVYDPRCFEIVARVEAELARVAARGGPFEPPTPEAEPIATMVATLVERYPSGQLKRRFAEGFDGFRTLKLIHALTERWPKRPWAEAVAAAPFIEFDPAIELDEQRRRLP